MCVGALFQSCGFFVTNNWFSMGQTTFRNNQIEIFFETFRVKDVFEYLFFLFTVVTAGNEDDFIDVEGDEHLLHQYAQQQQQNNDHTQQVVSSTLEGGTENDFSQVFEQMDGVSADDVIGVGGMVEGGGYTAAGMEEFEFTGGEFDDEGNFDGNGGGGGGGG